VGCSCRNLVLLFISSFCVWRGSCIVVRVVF
jgi:hypothetical protein